LNDRTEANMGPRPYSRLQQISSLFNIGDYPDFRPLNPLLEEITSGPRTDNEWISVAIKLQLGTGKR